MIVGIDFGNSGVKVSYPDRTGQPVGVKNARGGNSVRAFVHIDPQGKCLVGDDAFEQGFVDPKNTAGHFKLKLGLDDQILPGKTAKELAAILVKAAKELVEKVTGESIDAAVVTVPANFSDKQKKALLGACEEAGIKVLRIVSEPAAAAFAYACQSASNKRGLKFIVFDLGSSTFDVTVCEADGDEIRMLATEGIQKLGGDDIDEILKGVILAKLKQKTGKDPRTPAADPLFWLDLSVRTATAKIALGNQDKVQIPLSSDSQHHVVAVTKQEFEAAVRPLIEKTLHCVDAALKGANLSIGDITSLYMVGGPSRTPFIQNMVADHTRLVPRVEIDPELAVAHGAVLVALSELKRQGKQARMGVDTIPQPDAFLKEATHHDIGVAVEERATGAKRIINAVVVPKNTPVPCTRSESFRLESPDQTEVLIEILQGPDRTDIKGCQIIGRLELHGLPVEPARSPRIEVTYIFDKNTFVTVKARDKISGKEVSVTVQVPK